MVQVVEQTDSEKMSMYMKLPKKKIIEMLIECHKIIDYNSYITEIKKLSVMDIYSRDSVYGRDSIARNYVI